MQDIVYSVLHMYGFTIFLAVTRVLMGTFVA